MIGSLLFCMSLVEANVTPPIPNAAVNTVAIKSFFIFSPLPNIQIRLKQRYPQIDLTLYLLIS